MYGYLKTAIDKSITPLKILLVFCIFNTSANQSKISATKIAMINVFSFIIKPPCIIILYTILQINQVILYNLPYFYFMCEIN